MKEGAIVDATIVSVPIQRNTQEENETIKQDQIPKIWKEDGRKLCQKDTDARWTKKHGKSYHGRPDSQTHQRLYYDERGECRFVCVNDL
ncbi:hypothetical protein LEP1GSC188_3747 [Leptospira weilii serovar Topaz str. LT2116]|uniref:Transposase, IS4-like family protein n=1 Tax=Leptospira weilii serovar Topaz str. LT2116 TaxID=1088540 RepID=M3GUT7_9LEPT|nr:hypothetical protein LEP1GSC188_3747 [Leptospira weilii serovar Topaz str. LT2116]